MLAVIIQRFSDGDDDKYNGLFDLFICIKDVRSFSLYVQDSCECSIFSFDLEKIPLLRD